LPRNSESRAIAVVMRMFKKHKPNIKWILSFADGCQCGDGTIYRASGFVLTDIKKNNALRINPKTGDAMHTIQAWHLKKQYEFKNWQPLSGYMFRYIYFLDKDYREKLNVPVIPFSKIKEMQASMYRGTKVQS